MKNQILVHICCSVDSHFFLQELQNLHPHDEIISFFYDPNIHPFSEYQLRLLDVKRSCKILKIKLIEEEYNYEEWLTAVRGLENEPEKGARCQVCFDNRLLETAKEARKRGFKFFTTTLLTSPKKSIEQLKIAGDSIGQKYQIKFLTYDFRVGGGTNRQFAMAKEAKVYHQDYCGCIFALTKQREGQDRLADELMSSIGGQVMPESIESRIELYEKRVELEEQGRSYKIVREKFLNYRLLGARVKNPQTEISSYVIAYSYLRRKSTKGKIAFKIKDLYYFNREEIKFISLLRFNEILGTDYEMVKELIFNPPKFQKEVELRAELLQTSFSLSPIIVLDFIDEEVKYEIKIDAKIYNDVREQLIEL